MKSVTIEHMVIVFLIILLVVVFLIKDEPQNQNKFAFYVVEEGTIIPAVFRLNKETGQVHLIYKEKIIECGTRSGIFRDKDTSEFDPSKYGEKGGLIP